jgi:DNA-binding transcriptional ArsR family regulator
LRKSEIKGAAKQRALVFAALAHPSRREILLVLNFRAGRMAAGEIAERFACRWPTTTRHLGVLEKAGLVRVEKKGRTRIYHLCSDVLQVALGDWLKWFPVPRGNSRDGSN